MSQRMEVARENPVSQTLHLSGPSTFGCHFWTPYQRHKMGFSTFKCRFPGIKNCLTLDGPHMNPFCLRTGTGTTGGRLWSTGNWDGISGGGSFAWIYMVYWATNFY